MAARKGAGRYIKFKYVVKLLNKGNKDQSKEKHEAVLENQGYKPQKGMVVGICACQNKDTKQNVSNDQTTARHKHKILIVCWFVYFL